MNVLLVEDNAGDARLAREMLSRLRPQAPEVVHVSRLAAALPYLSPLRCEAVMLDLGLPDSQGLDTLVRVRAAAPDAAIVVATGRADEQTAIDALRLGAQDYVVKGRLDADGLNRSLRYAMERKLAELRQRESEEQYHLLFLRNPHPTWVVDRVSLAFVAVNDAACAHHGFRSEQLLAMRVGDLLVDESGRPLRDRLAAAGWEGERVPGGLANALRLRRQDGSVAEVALDSSPIRFADRPALLVFVTDVTETRRLENQLRQAQKMEAVGQLAGGIAHDFNNLLGVILGQGEMLGRAIPDGHPGQGRVAEVIQAAERAAGLTRQLLAFGRRQVLTPEVLDLNDLVVGMERLLRRLLPETIDIVAALQPALGRVRADRGQLEQVVVNLAVNARDAMPAGGRLVLATADVELDEAQARVRPELAPGSYVVLGVEDTGTGIPAATLNRIFEPFFTTKPEGLGTGLGLATVYGIVKQSGGHVAVYSELGRGTAFRVYLPRVEDPLSPSRRTPAAEPRGGSETVLVVEDQAALRSLVAEILTNAGYRVLMASSAEDAADIARAEPTEVHLLVTDMVLPGRDGPSLVLELRQVRPALKVLLMSGYAPDTTQPLSQLGAGLVYLQKPFTMTALLQAARELLDARA